MPKIKDVESEKRIREVASELLRPNGSGQDIIWDVFSSFTDSRPILTEPSPDVIDAVAAWIGDCEVADRSE